MKKRRSCTWRQSRSPGKNLTRPPHVCLSETLPPKTKSVYELKHQRSDRGRSKNLPRRGKQSNGSFANRELFASLDSLFDVENSLIVPELYSQSAESFPEGGPLYPLETASPRDQINSLRDLLLQTFSPSCAQEPHILRKTHDTDDFYPKGESKESLEVESLDLREIFGNATKMADENGEVEVKTEIPDEDSEVPEGHVDEFVTEDEGGEEGEEGEEADSPAKEDLEEEETVEKVEEEEVKDEEVEESEDFEGIEKKGDEEPAEEDAVPEADTMVLNEMQMADKKCQAIAQEIEQLRCELAELGNKKDLTQEEKITMQEKHEDLMVKVAEFEEITQKIQQLLGLSVPLIKLAFDKAQDKEEDLNYFDYNDKEEDLDAEEWRKSKERYREARDEDRFSLPSSQYPEDNLPRVIVCGYTEDEIPKIVVADGERRERKSCLDNVTGRLTESLNMQEKLAKENAQLEGGKYKLEEALLEKDSAVESLQRKVCGLQAEMKMVVKENMELTRQMACLSQRITSTSCDYTCPGVSPSTTATSSRFPYEEDLLRDYCECKCCVKPFPDASPSNPAVAYGNPESCRGGVYPGSLRLTGGASRGGICCLTGASSTRSAEMCCRNPAIATKVARNSCPPEPENRFSTYGNTTRQLEQQLGSMENEVRNMQMELANVQRERQQLEQQRKLLKCTGPCAPCSCCPAPASFSTQPQGFSQFPSPPPMPISPAPKQSTQACSGPCANAPMGTSSCPQQQLRDLREQYGRLQEDYKNKLVEVSCLRSDAEKLKQESRNAREEKEKMEIKMIDAQERLKILENDKNSFEGNKEQLVEQEQALLVAKQRFREAQDEIEELRSLVHDQAIQLEDYRNKYLQAQETVEEQRRQMDLMEMDNARMNENVTLEIGRVKNQFQEKLAELAPLPDILKQCQMKLQEAQQLRLVAERNCEDLSRELLGCKDKIQTLQNQLDVLHNERMAYQEGKGTGAEQEEMELRLRELRHENERTKNTLARFEEHEAQLQKRIDEKNHEITQLTAMLEQLREDSARQVARTKERCETVRKTMQSQISEMEKQLAQCRATARAAQKDRDEIRQKMQGQINNLNEAFEQAQGRIRSLQGHVNYLKTSYTNIFKGQGEASMGGIGGEGGTGYDSCDCNY